MDSIIDTDWCLTCIKRTAGGKGYCSRECKLLDNGTYHHSSASSEVELSVDEHITSHHRPPSSPSCLSAHRALLPVDEDALLALQLEWPGYNEDGIRAWARAIPPGCVSTVAYCSGATPSTSRSRPNFPLSRQRPAQPALCTSAATQPALAELPLRSSTTSPINTRHSARGTFQLRAGDSASSLVSTLSESIATPSSSKRNSTRVSPVRAPLAGKPSLLNGLASRLRSVVPSPAPAQRKSSPAKALTTIKDSCASDIAADLHKSQTSDLWRYTASGFTVLAQCEGNRDNGFGFSTGSGVLSDAELFASLDTPKCDVWIAPSCDGDLCSLHESTGRWEKSGHNPELVRSLHARNGVEESTIYRSRGRRITRS